MSLYEHFRKEEHAFVDQVLDWKAIVELEYRPKLTDFLDPRQQKIVQLLVGSHDDVHVSFWGGHSEAERKRALLYPDYITPVNEDFRLTAFELRYPSKFITIEHSQILGSLMSIGMKREKFGDILSEEDQFQLILSEEVADYVVLNLQSVGKAKVELKPISEDDVMKQVKELEETFVTVSSLRVDTVISEAFHLSRSKVKPAIVSEKVKVNWKVINDPAFQLEKGDVLSFRGKGRCEIVEMEGQTKKGKQRLILGFPK
ncbi:RNA-binding protein [Salipaludibacillus keqinensis]|uniref:RNA-binding protein n=1 Tax=Salipaludibacillus keqinensis TaxID=2045207 RepID=A0A323TH42_9BACI|nr:RNA-binding protein [Salipaludibacillus keqinensis]PYZ93224.1 RNA-binding protein [Salipaludibacillus keqinensis]